VTMRWIDLILILAFVAMGSAVSYLILIRRIRQVVIERHLQIADQLAALDDAVRALETRLAEHHAASDLIAAVQGTDDSSLLNDPRDEESETISPDIQAVIAASAVAALGQDIHIRSMKPATSSWSKQGRVLVQGSHNARARR
jgi:hypothetical protein